MPLWAELTRIGFIRAAEETEVAVMVTGAVEAHGTHMPLGTDVILPTYITETVAKRTKALVLPPVPFGDSWIFEPYQGTVSVRPVTLIAFYADVMESVFRHGFRFIVVVNGHGGNVSHLRDAAKRATDGGDRAVIIVNWWHDLGKEARRNVIETIDGHAAEDETSEMLYVRPELVDMKSAQPAVSDSKYIVVSANYRSELYPSAVHGDPRPATAEKGRAIVEAAIDELIELIETLERGEIPIEIRQGY